MRRSQAFTFLTSCLIAVLAGCGPTGGGTGNSGGSGGSGTGGSGGQYTGGSGGGSGGTGGVGGIDNTPDAMNCGVQTFTPTQGLPPDVLIVLDKSGSMMDPPGSGGASKWVQVTGAINSTVGMLQAQIKFGLEFFPTDSSCGVASVAVPVMANAGTAISTAIAGQGPGGSTPTADAIYRGAMSLAGVSDNNPKYILLATDGDPTCAATLGAGGTGGTCMCPSGFTMNSMGQCCIATLCVPCSGLGGNAPADAVTAVGSAQMMGVHTFVIGVATDSTSDSELNMLAQAGGEQRPGGPPYYYQVQNQQDLINAINAIAGQIISCNLQLPMRPPYPDQVTVTANGQMVPRDTTHMNGWDFGPGDMSIQFYGSYCSMLQSGGINNVQAIYGCPPIGIHR